MKHIPVLCMLCVVSAIVTPGTIGNGLAATQVCYGSEHVLFNTTLPSSVVQGRGWGMLSHFWSTGSDNLLLRYYIDDEPVASIAFSPPLAAGQGWAGQGRGGTGPDTPGGLFTAGGKTGRAGSVGGWYVDWKIPFYSSVRVTASLADTTAGACSYAWMIVRGYIEQGATAPSSILTLPSGLALPFGAKLQLQTLVNTTYPPLWPISLANVTFGMSGLLLAVSIQTSTQPAGNNYVEGCWTLTPTGNITWPQQGTLVLGTGMEDFFNSAFWFGAASGYPGGLLFSQPGSGLTHFTRQNDTEQIGAYRYLDAERVGWEDGGRLHWRVGDQSDKCLDGGVGRPIGSPSAVTLSSYTWLYTWPNGGTVGPLPEGPPPGYMTYACDTASATCVPVFNASGRYWTSTCEGLCGMPPGPPEQVGCADGTCEAYCSMAGVRGCAASWPGSQSLRTPGNSTPGSPPCGGPLQPCAVPADACAQGWAICASNFTDPALSLEGFRAVMDAGTCSDSSVPGAYAGAVSHAQPAWSSLPPAPCPPANIQPSLDNGCAADGWGAEPICCGSECLVPSCPSYVWPNSTRIRPAEGEGCGAATSGVGDGWLTGVLCCKL